VKAVEVHSKLPSETKAILVQSQGINSIFRISCRFTSVSDCVNHNKVHAESARCNTHKFLPSIWRVGEVDVIVTRRAMFPLLLQYAKVLCYPQCAMPSKHYSWPSRLEAHHIHNRLLLMEHKKSLTEWRSSTKFLLFGEATAWFRKKFFVCLLCLDCSLDFRKIYSWCRFF